MLSGISARSRRSLRDQRTRQPATNRCQQFSLSPPIVSTSPRSVISPVIAISQRTGMGMRQTPGPWPSRYRPTDHPSASRLPGKCGCRSSQKALSAMPSLRARARTTVRPAWTDSFMTSPRLPVASYCPCPASARIRWSAVRRRPRSRRDRSPDRPGFPSRPLAEP